MYGEGEAWTKVAEQVGSQRKREHRGESSGQGPAPGPARAARGAPRARPASGVGGSRVPRGHAACARARGPHRPDRSRKKKGPPAASSVLLSRSRGFSTSAPLPVPLCGAYAMYPIVGYCAVWFISNSSTLIRQPAQGAARVPGRRRHGWHVRCMSFTGFWLYRSAGHLNSLITGFTYVRELAIFPPPDVCHPSASSDGTLVKNRGDPERARLIERPSLPSAAPRLPRLPPPSSTLPTAVRAGLRNLHTAFNMGKGKGAPENPALAHAPDSSKGLSLLALTLRSGFCFSGLP